MNILSVSSTIFQPFGGGASTFHVTAVNTYILTPTAFLSASREAPSDYIMTPGASIARMDFGVGTGGVGPTYIFTATAIGGLVRFVSASSTYTFTAADGALGSFEVEAAATYIFTPDSSSVVDRVAGVGIGSDTPTYIFTPLGTHTTDFKVLASSTYIFTPDSSERHVETGTGAVTYIFTAQASALKVFLGGVGVGDDTPTYIFTPAADSHVPDPHRDTDPVTYIFEANATAIVVALACTPLGRFRRGDVVPIELALPYVPDQPPVAVVLDEDDEVVDVFSMGRDPVDPGVFLFDLFVGPDYLLERYILVFTVLAGGVQVKQIDQCFTVIGGGDAGGPVISLVCYQRGKSQAVLAHLGSGELVLGKNPSLDYTPPSALSR